jgi:hypothetical protein
MELLAPLFAQCPLDNRFSVPWAGPAATVVRLLAGQ